MPLLAIRQPRTEGDEAAYPLTMRANWACPTKRFGWLWLSRLAVDRGFRQLI